MRSVTFIPSLDGMHVDVYDAGSGEKIKTYNLYDLCIGTKIDLMRELVKLTLLTGIEIRDPGVKRHIKIADQ